MPPPSVCRDPLGTFRVKSSPFELEAPSSFGTYRSNNNLHYPYLILSWNSYSNNTIIMDKIYHSVILYTETPQMHEIFISEDIGSFRGELLERLQEKREGL